MFKFGRSTRMYILGGPTELMPEEGLTKKQMLTMKALEVRHSHFCRLRSEHPLLASRSIPTLNCSKARSVSCVGRILRAWGLSAYF